jgi:hypothetical protein
MSNAGLGGLVSGNAVGTKDLLAQSDFKAEALYESVR